MLSPAGLDLTRGEFLRILDAARHVGHRARVEADPTVILDFGDVSENVVRFSPDTLKVVRKGRHDVQREATRRVRQSDSGDRARSVFALVQRGDQRHRASRRRRRYASSSSTRPERIAPRTFASAAPRPARSTSSAIRAQTAQPPTTSSTKTTSIMDNALNFSSAQRESERMLRYVVDLNAPSAVHARRRALHRHAVRSRPAAGANAQLGARARAVQDADRLAQRRQSAQGARASAHARLGAGTGRRGAGPIADRRAAGRRRAVARPEQSDAGRNRRHSARTAGSSSRSTIGTTDSSAAVVYQPPPGIVNEAAQKGAQFQGALTTINESSLRIQTGNLPLYHRAEAYFRFPAGPAVLHGVPAAQRVGPRPRERLGAERRRSRCTSRSGATRTTSTCTARR